MHDTHTHTHTHTQIYKYKYKWVNGQLVMEEEEGTDRVQEQGKGGTWSSETFHLLHCN